MIEVQYRATSELKFDPGPPGDCIQLPDGAQVYDLIVCLDGYGIDVTSKVYLVIFNDRGLLQVPPDQPLISGDVLLVIPPLMGG